MDIRATSFDKQPVDDKWDKQFEVDAMDGKLDKFSAKAVEEFRKGNYSKLSSESGNENN